MGGLFILKEGRAHQHVMRDFSTTPIYTLGELNEWLKFFEMPAELYALGTLVTHEHVSLRPSFSPLATSAALSG